MIGKYLIFGVSVVMMSWIAGLILNMLLMKTSYYQKVSSLNFIRNKTWNQFLGVGLVKWIIKNSFFKFFNPKIKVDHTTDLLDIRKEMTIAEIGHLIGFVIVLVVAFYKGMTHSYLLGLTILIVNVFMNLNPSLLQQENKRRIDRLIQKRG